MELDMRVSEVYTNHRIAKQHLPNGGIIVHQGGARSTKTYSILQDMQTDAFERPPIEFDVIRKSLPSLRGSALRDFFDILDKNDLYRQSDHNKSDNTYRLNGCNFNFYSLDDQQKVRGRKRDIVFLNEANEMTLEDFRQISLRTTKYIYLDYNPSDETSWIYDEVLPRTDCILIKSTFLDNPFLEERIKREILRLKDTDENDWTVFGLGERGKKREVIYTNWEECDDFPSGLEVFYGIDFGFTDPTVVLKIGRRDDDLWIDERIYKSEITNSDLIREMRIGEISRSHSIYADAQEPARVKEIKNAGFSIMRASKDIQDGIDFLKRFRIHITSRSRNTIKDFKLYCWQKDRAGDIVNGQPSHNFSHAPDAVRYGAYSHLGHRKFRVVQFR